MRELYLTTSIVEVTVDYCEGADFAHVMLEVLTLRIHPTLVRARHWAKPANWPVFGRYIFEISCIVAAVVTAEGTSDALFDLVGGDTATLEKIAAVTTLDLGELTAGELVM